MPLIWKLRTSSPLCLVSVCFTRQLHKPQNFTPTLRTYVFSVLTLNVKQKEKGINIQSAQRQERRLFVKSVKNTKYEVRVKECPSGALQFGDPISFGGEFCTNSV